MRIIIFFSAIILAACSAEVSAADVVLQPQHRAYTHADALFSDVPVVPKVQYVYQNPQSRCRDTVTVYRSQDGAPLLEITSSMASRVPRLTVDTVLITADGEIARRAHASWLNGEWESKNYNVRTINDHVRWSLSPKFWRPTFSDNIVLHDYDSQGQWTKASVAQGDNSMLESPLIERNVVNELTPDEIRMTEAYEAMLVDVDSEWNGQLMIGMLIMVVAGLLAAFTLTAQSVSEAVRGKVAGYLVGILATCGFLYLFNVMLFTYGMAVSVGSAFLFLVLMCWYIRYTVMHLEDNKALSNRDASNPFAVTVFAMALVGWWAGLAIYAAWWSGAICAVIFAAAPILSVPNRGLRCPKCHRMGTYRHTSDADVKHEFVTSNRTGADCEEATVKHIRRFRKVYECSACGLREVSPTFSQEVVEKKVRKRLLDTGDVASPSASSSVRPSSNSAVDYRSDYI